MAEITKSQMAKLFYRLANTYSAGIDLRSAFERESQHGGVNYRLKLGQIWRGLSQGQTLSECMQATQGYFPPLAIAIIKAGERGGRLEDSFKRLGHHYEHLVQFRNRFLLSIAWPLFELVMAVGVIGLLILIHGWIMESNNLEPVHWFGINWAAQNDFWLYLFLVVLVFGGLATVAYGFLKGWFGTLPMRVARYLPLVGKTIESLALSRFAWTMSIAENAGMSAVDTLRLAFQATQNYYYARLEDACLAQIVAGRQFYPVLQETQAFPADFLLYVSNGETAGQLAETMERASKVLQESAENNLKLISVFGFVITFLFVAFIIGFTVITLYQQLYLGAIRQFQI